MQELAQKINSLKNSPVSGLVQERLRQFKALHSKGNDEWFSELCFCILTANSTAEKGIQIQNALGAKGFLSLPQKQLTKKLKTIGHRFYNKRAEFIVEARKNRNIKDKVLSFESEAVAREWLVENIKGIGCKEASHFLRNVGFENSAILDRHVFALMHEHSMIQEKPKTVSKRCYFESEKKLAVLAEQTGLSQAALDLYLWFMKTGKVLK